MSGLEVVGVVASILQIADLGAKLSVKLCTFYRTVKVANQSMQDLSCDVSLTCSILSELAKALEQDDQAKLCSEQAFCIAQEVLQECKAVFQQIENAVEKHNQDGEKNRFTRGARKITVALLGPNLDVLKSNLERLKSTTLLMLHVIMYAAELRKRKAKSTLTDQRNIIHALLEEKKANIAKFDQLSNSIKAFSIREDDGSRRESSKGLSTEQQSPPLSMELRNYHTLVQRLLYEIDACQYSLDESRHLRIRNGIVNLHSAEAVIFQHTHGHAATRIFDDLFFKFRDAGFPAPETTGEPSGLICVAPNAYSKPRKSHYDPDYYYHHPRTREYDRPSRRKLDPGGSISLTSCRGSNQGEDYSSDDSMAYIWKKPHNDEDHFHDRHHLAEGVFGGVGASELLRGHSKKDGGEVNHGASRIGKIVDAGGLGAVAVKPASYTRDYYRRSRSRHRSHSFDNYRSSHRHIRHGQSRYSRSRSHSHSRERHLLELGAGALAVAGVPAGMAASHNKSKAEDCKSQSRSRSRSRCFSRGRPGKDGERDDSAHSISEVRRDMAGAGLAGAAVTGLVERARSRSRSRKGEPPRSWGLFGQDLPVVSAGLATAAATGLYEDRKGQDDEKNGRSHGQHRRTFQCRPAIRRLSCLSNPSDLADLSDSERNCISSHCAPIEHCYRQTGSLGLPYDALAYEALVHDASDDREGRYSSSSGSDDEDRSRSRGISSAAPDFLDLAYTERVYSQDKDRRESEEREQLREKESKEEVGRKRFRSCSDNDDAPRGRTRTHFNQNLTNQAVSDAVSNARRDGELEEEVSSPKCRRMEFPRRELEKSAEYDKVTLDASLTPKTAKKDISLSTVFDGAMEETLEGLVLQWTNLTREEIQIE